MEDVEDFLEGGLSVEGYEPLASLMDGDLESVVPELLLRLLGRGGVSEIVVPSELSESKNELRLSRAGVIRA